MTLATTTSGLQTQFTTVLSGIVTMPTNSVYSQSVSVTHNLGYIPQILAGYYDTVGGIYVPLPAPAVAAGSPFTWAGLYYIASLTTTTVTFTYVSFSTQTSIGGYIKYYLYTQSLI